MTIITATDLEEQEQRQQQEQQEQEQEIFETSVNKTSRYTKSLKTIVPFLLTEQLKIRNGDKLKWKKNTDNTMTVWTENSIVQKKPIKKLQINKATV